MGMIRQAQANERRAKMRLARKMGNYDNSQAGADSPRRQYQDRMITAANPAARGASFSASVLSRPDVDPEKLDQATRLDLGKALLAKKLGGGDLIKGGDFETRKKLRLEARRAKYIQAAQGG